MNSATNGPTYKMPPLQSMPTEPDPNGNIVLLVGSLQNVSSLRVSSHILSLASKVFAAMFGPHFAEGSSPATEGRQVELPEDDGPAMNWICKALHFQLEDPEEMTLDLIEQVAIQCDKYDLSKALKPWSKCAITNWYSPMRSDGVRLLAITASLELPVEFWHSTLRVVNCKDSQAQLRDLSEGLLGCLPRRLIEHLMEQSETRRQEICSEMEAIQMDLLNDGVATAETAATLVHHLTELQRLGTNFWYARAHSLDLSATLEKLIQYKQCNQTQCNCKALKLKERMESLVSAILDKTVGVCLKCAKRGKIMQADGHCLNGGSRESYRSRVKWRALSAADRLVDFEVLTFTNLNLESAGFHIGP